MPQLEASNVSLVLKEPTVQQMDCRRMFFALMAHIPVQKARVIVQTVMLGSSVQVSEWKALKNVLMEHIVMQLVHAIVFCVLKATGEIFFFLVPSIDLLYCSLLYYNLYSILLILENALVDDHDTAL